MVKYLVSFETKSTHGMVANLNIIFVVSITVLIETTVTSIIFGLCGIVI